MTYTTTINLSMVYTSVITRHSPAIQSRHSSSIGHSAYRVTVTIFSNVYVANIRIPLLYYRIACIRTSRQCKINKTNRI